MILIDEEILDLSSSEKPLISPFHESRLRGASYDVTIGSTIQSITSTSGVVDLNVQNELNQLYVKRDISDGFIIKPGQFVLAPLNEVITLPDDVIARVMPRTRFTRLGLLISSQFCNPSYSGRLSIGIQNVSPNNIRIVPGLSVAQLVFEKLSKCPTEERLYRNQSTSAYHNESGFIGAVFDDVELSPSAKALYERMRADLIGD